MTPRTSRTAALAVIALSVIGVRIAGQVQAPPPAAPPVSQAPKPPASPQDDLQDYRVGPLDGIRVEVPRDPSIFPTRSITIQVDGTISYYNSNSLRLLKVSGLTTRQIEKLIGDGMIKDGYETEPTVIVTVETFKSKIFFVNGEVGVPGQQHLEQFKVTLLQAIAAVGGVTPKAGPNIIIRRHKDPSVMTQVDARASDSDSNTITLTFNRDALMAGTVPDPAIQDGDTIVVPKGQSVIVNGEVRTPKDVPWFEGITVQQAINACNGPSDHGALNRLSVFRTDPKTGKQTEVKPAKLTTVLEPGDVVKVPKKFFG